MNLFNFPKHQAINKMIQYKKPLINKIISLCNKLNLDISNKSFNKLRNSTTTDLKDYIKQLKSKQ